MRTLLLSWGRRLGRVHHAPVAEAEASIANALGAHISVLTPHRFSTFRAARLRNRFDPIPPLRISNVASQPADVGIMVFPTGSVVPDLLLVPKWRALAHRWVAVVHECWPDHFAGRLGEFEAVLGEFEAVAVMTHSGALALSRELPGLNVKFAPFAVDARMATVRRPQARGITIFNPGRRDATQHAAFRKVVGDNLYLFDTFAPGQTDDLAVHRAQYMNTISHSRLMVTNYAKFNQASETGGAVEVGLRVTEALTCGAIPIGHHPTTIEMDGLDRSWFGPFLQIGPDNSSESIIDAVRDVLADQELGERVAVEGPRFVASHHDWSHRVAELLQAASIDVPQSLRDHQNELLERFG